MTTELEPSTTPARRRRGRRLLASVAAVATVFGLTVSVAPAAWAGGPYRYASGMDAANRTRLTVCAADLGVRHSRGGAAFAYLRNPQTFQVWSVDAEFGSEWVYGFAYGNVNAAGYVQNGWFCLQQ